jgi:hypothetical protein
MHPPPRLGLIALALAVAVGAGCGVCPGTFSAGGGSCTLQWPQCGGHSYRVDCGPIVQSCSCSVDGNPTATFAPTGTNEGLCYDANVVGLVKTGCNWSSANLGTPTGCPVSDTDGGCPQ